MLEAPDAIAQVAFVPHLFHNWLVAKPALDLSSLTSDEKFELIDELWQSVNPNDLQLSQETRDELDRRLAKLDRDGITGTAWADVRAEMVPDKL
jgi:putative addiction module component (TIGR02574 family)